MNLKEHLKKFNNQPSRLPVFQPKELEKLFKEAKHQFYDFYNSKWQISPCRNYINRHKLNSHNFIKFLNHLFTAYFEMSDIKNGRKGAFHLLTKLENSKSFNSAGDKTKLQLKKEIDVMRFVTEMKVIKENYLNINQEAMIKFLYENFNTGYTYSTLRKKYLDKKTDESSH